MPSRFHRDDGFSSGASSSAPTFEVDRVGSARFDAGIRADAIDIETNTANVKVTIADDTDSTSRELLRIYKNNATRANNDTLQVGFAINDNVGTGTVVVRQDILVTDVTDTSEDGAWRLQAIQAGTLRNLIDAGFVSGGTGNVVINEDSVDCDFRVETDNIANGFVCDAGNDNFGFGAAANASSFLHLTPAAKSGTPAAAGNTLRSTTYTFTDNATSASGTATAFASYSFIAPTLAATNTSVTTTDAATLYVDRDPIAGTNETLTNPWALWVDAGASRFDARVVMAGAALTAAAPGLTGGWCNVAAATYTDNSTSASGTATNGVFVSVSRPTYAASNTSVTVTNAAAFYIANDVAAGTNTTLTNTYAMWVDAGLIRFDGNVTIGGTAALNSGTNALSLTNGTAATGASADSVVLYSRDISAGNTTLGLYAEGTSIVATGQGDSTSSVRVILNINGTDRTFLCI